MDYKAAKLLIQSRVEKSRENVGVFDLYSMILADDLQAVINMIDELEQGSSEERLSWEYAYLLGQAIGNLDTAESILHYFGKTMGDNAEALSAAFSAIDHKLITLHPELNA
ncbi:hypothetical protein MMG00_04980 [Ignatzschineria rhizosphaerae]|uniref:Uncharacterized protein n=1 Tax=Ignatzschineria rhizosphaerae TaxID=2923279 RepID=A0ABY3X827_9GAMM|nr:hypothetical protein [Ignatzschineria rhizosphaerae]UNM97207.1 hypothetical protein MMG00_04980 [Ignatzschineria rhizosphaerae]